MWRFAVVERFKKLASFFCVGSRDTPGSSPATTHIGRPHSLLTTALGTGRSTITCSVWADSASCTSMGVVNEHLPSFGGSKDETETERR